MSDDAEGFLAKSIVAVAEQAVAAKGAFSLCLGAGVPAAALDAVAKAADLSAFHCFLSEDATQGAGAGGVAASYASFLDKVPKAQVYRIPEFTAADAAEEYGWTVRAAGPCVSAGPSSGDLPSLDLVVLSETSSLEGGTGAVAVDVGDDVRLTYAMVLEADKILVAARDGARLESDELVGTNVQWVLDEATAGDVPFVSDDTKTPPSPSRSSKPLSPMDPATRDPQAGLDTTIQLGIGATAVLGALFVGFLASNGLLGAPPS